MALKRTERGWGAHFCGAYKCDFRRNTLLELDELKIIVSTVGGYRSESCEKTSYDPAYKKIGVERFYETMAFEALYSEYRYIDINSSREIPFSSKWTLAYPNVDDVANNMHEDVIKEISEKLLNGKIKNFIDKFNEIDEMSDKLDKLQEKKDDFTW